MSLFHTVIIFYFCVKTLSLHYPDGTQGHNTIVETHVIMMRAIPSHIINSHRLTSYDLLTHTKYYPIEQTQLRGKITSIV